MFADGNPSVAMWVFLAFAVERLVEIVVKAIPVLKQNRVLGIEAPFILSFVFSLLTSVGAGLDFFQMFNIPFSLPAVGHLFTALVMAGGSNLVHDFVGWVRNNKEISESRIPRMQ